ncbi:MAG: ZIP family metal transporter [Longimicrobiales bacterium]
MSIWAQTLIAVVAVGAASLVGAVFLGKREDRLDTILMYLVSLSAGVLVGGAVLHLLPQAFANQKGPLETPLYFLCGFLGFFFLERYLWRSHHDHSHFPHPRSEEPDMASDHAHGGHSHNHGDQRHKPAAAMAIVGGGFHNFIDGAVIAASFALDARLGWITTGAVLLHEIPREFGDFGILVHSGIAPRKALWLNALSGLGALAGAVLVLVIGARADGLANALVAITAGNFVYIAAANLIPEIHHHHPRAESLGHALVLLMGVTIMLALALAEPLLAAG